MSLAKMNMNNVQPLLVPPHSIQAEQGVLGSIIVEPESIDKVSWMLREDDFYSHDHKLVYQTLVAMTGRNQPVDIITVSDELRDKRADDSIALVADLARNVPSAANIKGYANTVKEKALLRKTISATHTIQEICYDPQGQAAIDVIGFAEQQLGQVSESIIKPSNGGDVDTVLSEVVDELEARSESGEKISGRSTGLDDLDERLDGLEPAELVVIAARPSQGKTTLALNMVRHDILNGGKSIVFSLETSRKKLMRKMIADISHVFLGKLKSADMDDVDWSRISRAMSMLKDTAFHIEDDYHLTIPKMRLSVRRFVKKHGSVTTIMVDYLQLMSGVKRTDNRTNEIAEISVGLKGIAKEFNCTILAISQLNRGVEQRANKRPLLSDLRESGQIEQDADKIIFVYRDEYYNENTEYKGIAELIVAKSKEGEVGKVAANFNGAESRFSACNFDVSQINEEPIDASGKDKPPRPYAKRV